MQLGEIVTSRSLVGTILSLCIPANRSTMLGELLKGFSDFGVVRRGIYFVNYVPKVIPNFAGQLSKFVSQGQKRKRSCGNESHQEDYGDAIGHLASNLTTLFPDTRKGEYELWKELHEHSMEENEQALGAVLISKKTHCRLCKKSLYVKTCRISEVVVYDETKGTFLASKIPKVCTNKNCQFTQHYGYYTIGSKKFCDEDWWHNEFLVTSARTVFSIDLLKKFEIEVLIAKMSFKEKAEIYNASNGYHTTVTTSNKGMIKEGSR